MGITNQESPVAPPAFEAKRPSHFLKMVRNHTNAQGQTRAYWDTIGVVFQNKNGFTLKFHAFPTNPETTIVMTPPKDDEE